jgi:pumilio family protein 6
VPVVPALNFADILYPHIEDHIIDWATGSSSFVVLALTEAASFSKKDDLIRILKENRKKLQKAAKEETSEQKSRREVAATEKDIVKSKGKKSRSVKVTEVGNKGSALLLEKL